MFPTGTPLNQQNIGTTIRQPSTANLSIDSTDRVGFQVRGGGDPANFTISKNENIMSGFFTRITPQEIVLDWAMPNIQNYKGIENDVFAVFIAGYGGNSTQIIALTPGFYTIAECLDAMVAGLNASYFGTTAGLTFTLYTNQSAPPNKQRSGRARIQCVDGSNNPKNFTFASSYTNNFYFYLPSQLGIPINVAQSQFVIDKPNLVFTPYIDFTSPQLTYNQALKDGSTALTNSDTIYRWYFAWDGVPDYDEYGFAINMGYKPFIVRRIIPYPKQIAWTPNQPIGQLTFQVLDADGNILKPNLLEGTMEWFMNMLVSEN